MEFSIRIFINAGDNWLPPTVDYVTDVRNRSVTPAQPLSQVSLSANSHLFSYSISHMLIVWFLAIKEKGPIFFAFLN